MTDHTGWDNCTPNDQSLTPKSPHPRSGASDRPCNSTWRSAGADLEAAFIFGFLVFPGLRPERDRIDPQIAPPRPGASDRSCNSIWRSAGAHFEIRRKLKRITGNKQDK